MTISLAELALSDREWCRQRAQIALETQQLHAAGEISDQELAELMLDLVRADRLDSEADDLEVKTLLVTAIYAAGNLI